MPEFTLIHLGLLALLLLIGTGLGWLYRGDRCGREKIAINTSWQQQIDSRQTEHDRLIEQNKSLMQQISQYQASHKESALRAKELRAAVEEGVAQQEQLKKDMQELRGKLDATITHRDELQSNLANREHEDARTADALKKKDAKIFRLSQELENWQNRVPPLVERFRERDAEAKQIAADLENAQASLSSLQATIDADRTGEELADARQTIRDLQAAIDADNSADELATAQQTIAQLRAAIDADQTRMEPSDPNALQGNMDASNDQHAQTLAGGDIEEFQALASDTGDNSEVTEAQGATDAGPDAVQRDDLQKIKGVGPAIEKTLNELGIFRFHQISEMSEYDIDRVAQKLRGFRSRIYREDWIGQARLLRSQQFDSIN